MWYCDVEMDCILINQNERGENHKLTPVDNAKSGILRLTPESVNDGIVKQKLDASLLEDPEKGFVMNGTVILEARITVHTSGKRFRKKFDHDFYSPSNASNGILVVERKKVYVNKQFLALHSPFFDRLFFGEFKEAIEAETEIKDVDPDEFEVLLKILYRFGEKLSDESVEYVLKLADRFEMNILLDKAEKYLLSSEMEFIHWKLRLSGQYNLQILQDQVLSEYTAELIRELMKSEDYEMLSDQTKIVVLEKYVELTTPE